MSLSKSYRRGYTLIELVVTVLIIGILTSIAVPQYLRTVETGKADDAVAIVNMIGTTNKMFALDHNGIYAAGAFPTGAGAPCGTTVACGDAAMNAAISAGNPAPNACYLVACKYLADQDWGDKPYRYTAVDGKAAGNRTASTARAPGASPTYAGWGYNVGTSGVITAVGTSPPPTF